MPFWQLGLGQHNNQKPIPEASDCTDFGSPLSGQLTSARIG
jgi:hypothetical protein